MVTRAMYQGGAEFDFNTKIGIINDLSPMQATYDIFIIMYYQNIFFNVSWFI